MAALQDLRIANKPAVGRELIPELLHRQWGLTTELAWIQVLDSYDDANFYIEAVSQGDAAKSSYLLKFYNAIETSAPEFLTSLSSTLVCLSDKSTSTMAQAGVKVPTPVKLLDGSSDFIIIDCTTCDGNNTRTAVRIFEWIAGETLNSHASEVTASTFSQLGHTLNQMQAAFDGIIEPGALDRQHLWDLRQFHLSLELLPFMDDAEVKTIIQSVKYMYDSASSKLQSLPKNVIMGDANDANIIVQRTNTEDNQNPFQIVGIIDFSDTMYTWRVNEIAIAMAYGLVTPCLVVDDLTVISALFLGYSNVETTTQLTEEEVEVIPLLMAVRLCISVMVGAYTIHRNPTNEYLLLHAAPGRRALKRWYQLLQSETAQSLLRRLHQDARALSGSEQNVFLELAKNAISETIV